MHCVRKVSVTTWAAPAMAASASPRLTTDVDRTFPVGCSAGASGRIASNGSVTGGRTSYVTSISAAASRAARLVSAATAASMSPT